jgi:hypothetical protein
MHDMVQVFFWRWFELLRFDEWNPSIGQKNARYVFGIYVYISISFRESKRETVSMKNNGFQFRDKCLGAPLLISYMNISRDGSIESYNDVYDNIKQRQSNHAYEKHNTLCSIQATNERCLGAIFLRKRTCDRYIYIYIALHVSFLGEPRLWISWFYTAFIFLRCFFE